MEDDIKLDGHHRATLEKIFGHPVSHNIQWHDVLSLLEHVGTVTEHTKGNFVVTLGSEAISLMPPRHGPDLQEEQVVDVRRLLKTSGITPETAERHTAS